MEDKKKTITTNESKTAPMTIPRVVIFNRGTEVLEDFFQASILTTETESYSEEKRRELAFGENQEIDKLNYLTQFANYGVMVLESLIGETDIQSMMNIRNYMNRIL